MSWWPAPVRRKVPTGHIGPHADLLPAFPYLGTPHSDGTGS